MVVWSGQAQKISLYYNEELNALLATSTVLAMAMLRTSGRLR